MKRMITTTLLVYIGAGCLLGAGLGYYGKCTSGTCPLTSTWWRGCLYGGVMGLVFYMVSGGGRSAAMRQSTKNVTLLTESDFDKEVVQSAEPVLVDFFATWCGPCKALAPVVEDLAGQFKGNIKFAKVDIDASRTLAQQYQIEAVPTLKLFQNGKVVDTITGMQSAVELHARLSMLLLAKDGVAAQAPGTQPTTPGK
jgi:thioredoxin 1